MVCVYVCVCVVRRLGGWLGDWVGGWAIGWVDGCVFLRGGVRGRGQCVSFCACITCVLGLGFEYLAVHREHGGCVCVCVCVCVFSESNIM